MENNQIQNISVQNLVFDPENPRLPSTIRNTKDTSDYEQGVIDWMLQFENVTELMGSIGEKGYFSAEPILVVPSLNIDGKFEVVEGNRRLTAVKLLNDPSKGSKKRITVGDIVLEANFKPDEIPCIVFQHRDEVLSYLAYKHITGVQPWDSLAKARYLKQLKETLPSTEDFPSQCRKLAKIIGSKANYVRLLLIGVEIYEKIEDKNFYDIPTLNEESFEFGVFYTALGRENISKYINVDFEDVDPVGKINEDHLEDLTKWIFQKNSENATRLGESRNLKHLNKILDNSYPLALQAFKENNKSLEESVQLTNHPDEVFQISIEGSLANLKTARDYLHQIQSASKPMEDTLLEISKLSRLLRNAVQDIILGLDDNLDS